MEMLKLCHHVCFTQKNNRNILSTICDRYSDLQPDPGECL